MKIERGIVSKALFRLIADKGTGLEIGAKGLTVLSRHRRNIQLSEIAGLSRIRRAVFFTAIETPLMNGRTFVFRGLGSVQAKSFADALNNAWLAEWRLKIDEHSESIQRLAAVIDRLDNPRVFPAACLVEPYWQKAKTLATSLPMDLSSPINTPQIRNRLSKISEFHSAPSRIRDKAIDRFIERELVDSGSIFETIQQYPLTREQQLALISDEDATLVLAGAGSGKTAVIVAKAAYLIKRRIRKPEEVLLIAYGKDAAKEMSERIKQCCDADVATMTFHKLAYDIITEVEGKRPPLASHLSGERLFHELLQEILFELAESDKGFCHMLFRWFSEFRIPARSQWDFKSRHEYYDYVERYELRTLQGEKVRSFEELMIANWLFQNGISYEYEPVYEHPLPDTGRKSYTPDFRLTESGVYVEHFGVRWSTNEKGKQILATAPYIDREKYLEQMDWKRRTHTEYGTTLIETFSYENVEGRLLSALEEKIAPYVTLKPTPLTQILSHLRNLGELNDLTGILITFLRHFKESDLTIEKCRMRARDRANSRRELNFLDIFEHVYREYQKRLGECIDFEGMITRATSYVKANRYRSPYRHLLVDEFQDISTGRAGLLTALKEQDSDCRVFAVGDDWQSIYRFAGSNIHIMQNFASFFGGSLGGESAVSRTVKLQHTFRSVDRIAHPARRFILKNSSQIEKSVIPADSTNESAIQIVWSKRNRDESVLEQALNLLSNRTKGVSATVLLIGRYNWSRPDSLSILNRRYPDLSISYKTIHASKGSEADHVVMLDAGSGRFGLPSEIVDDSLLELVLPRHEPFEHAEERRVFYVALTRARKSVTIIAPEDRPSPFVIELLEDKGYDVAEIGNIQRRRYPCSRCGGHMYLGAKNRYVCEHWDNCDANLPACLACRVDLPIRKVSEPVVNQCACGAQFPACMECADGWLVERRSKFGKFLGCVNYPVCRGRQSLKA